MRPCARIHLAGWLIVTAGLASCGESAPPAGKAPQGAPGAKPLPTPAAAEYVEPRIRVWPPRLEDLERAIPDYPALEQTLLEAAQQAGLPIVLPELRKKVGQAWHALCGSGGPLTTWQSERNKFDREVERRPLVSPEGKLTQTVKVLLEAGGWAYRETFPDRPEGVLECWLKVTFTQGRRDHGPIVTWGGQEVEWRRLTWDPQRARWVWRTLPERLAFQDRYEKQLEEERRATLAESARGPAKDRPIRNVDSLVAAHRSHLRHRYLGIFIRQFRHVPWIEPHP